MKSFNRYLVAVIIGVFTIALSQNVSAQSIEELEAENQELLDEIESLNETIINLEEQISELEELLEALAEEESESDADDRDGYGIGDEIEVDGVTIRVDASYYTDERNSWDDTAVDQVLVFEVYYENNTGDDYSPAFDFDVYYDGTKAESYSIGDIILDTVSDGRNSSGKLSFAIVGEPEVVELEYSPLFNIFSDSETVIIDITPE